MKYISPENKLFIANRQHFVSNITPQSIVILHSNDEFPQSGDALLRFKQSPDLYYLSGIDQEQSILILFPDSPIAQYREILFLKQTNEHIAVWEGHKYTKDEAKAASGIESIFWLDEYETILNLLLHYAETIYLNTNENDRYVHTVPYRDLRMALDLKTRFPLHEYKRAAPILRRLRSIKSEIEITQIKKACEITESAFRRVLSFVKPGVGEYEIEAEIIHEFIKNRATGHAYNPIIASGASACVLHYNDNNKLCQAGEVILLDFGAEYGNYNADLSRSIPVSGRFTERQKNVYNADLRVMKFATGLLKPGILLDEYQNEVGNFMQSELIDLGLLDRHDVEKQDKKMPLYKQYFMHGTSHFLGLDVHDFGNRYEKLEAGMVLTCEPGIYIASEGLGVRIENNIVLTEDGNIDMMATIPREVEEIEMLMNT